MSWWPRRSLQLCMWPISPRTCALTLLSKLAVCTQGTVQGSSADAGLVGLQFLSFTPIMNAWVGSFGADFNRPLLVATWGFGFVSAAALLIFTVMLMCWRDREAERQLEALERVALSHSAPVALPACILLADNCSSVQLSCAKLFTLRQPVYLRNTRQRAALLIDRFCCFAHTLCIWAPYHLRCTEARAVLPQAPHEACLAALAGMRHPSPNFTCNVEGPLRQHQHSQWLSCLFHAKQLAALSWRPHPALVLTVCKHLVVQQCQGLKRWSAA